MTAVRVLDAVEPELPDPITTCTLVPVEEPPEETLDPGVVPAAITMACDAG
jgi:hypothetical protein